MTIFNKVYVKTILAVTCLLVLASMSPAEACQVQFNARSYTERVEDADQVFIGVVEELESGYPTWARFRVETWIKSGVTGTSIAHVEVMLSTCGIAFQTGQRWFYAGSDTGSPSVLMDENPHRYQIRRRPDEDLMLAAKDQSCLGVLGPVKQCESVRYSCFGVVAVAAEQVQRLGKKLKSELGDPTRLDCPTKPKGPQPLVSLPMAVCVKKQCSILEIWEPAAVATPASGLRQR